MRIYRLMVIIALYFTFPLMGQVNDSNNREYQLHHQDDITTLTYSPDAKYIVTGSWDETVIIQKNDSSRAIMQRIHHHRGAIRSLDFSRDGCQLITGGQDGKINTYTFNDSFFSIASLDTTLVINESQINKLIYGPGMRTIFSAGDDGRVIIYDRARNKVIPIQTARPISAMGIAIDRMSYFIAHEKRPEIIQINALGRKMRTFKGHTGEITDIVVSVDRKHILSSSEDKTIRMWNIRSGKEVALFQHHQWTVTDIDIDPKGLYLTSGGLDGFIHLYDLKEKKHITAFDLSPMKVNAVAFSPDYTHILAAIQTESKAEKAGYCILSTGFHPHNIKLPKRYRLKKISAQPTPQKSKAPIQSPKKGFKNRKNPTKPKPNEKVIEKTDQLEIRIEE